MKAAVNAAAIQARNMVRIANEEIAKVIILRQNETPLFTNTMSRHFNLIAGNTAGGALTDNVVNKPFSFNDVLKHDRRWFIEQIREKMLSLSFHLNTGVYLIDMDTVMRTVANGLVIPFGTSVVADGYVFRRGAQAGIAGCVCGFRNGEIHVDVNDFPNYSVNSCARVIIHEAAHKFLGVPDIHYAKEPPYPPNTLACLGNADSFAWTAVSLATGAVRMAAGAGLVDWNNCP